LKVEGGVRVEAFNLQPLSFHLGEADPSTLLPQPSTLHLGEADPSTFLLQPSTLQTFSH